MNRTGRWLAAFGVLLAATACEGAEPTANPWAGRTRGGAVVLSRDEQVAVVVSRTAGVVTILKLAPDAELGDLITSDRTELDMGSGSEPWAAVIGADDDTAYVIDRQRQIVSRIEDLHDAPRLDEATAVVGAEPTAIAIAPSGDRLFVANWGEGTVSVITTPDFGSDSAIRGEWDLNEALARSGVLGEIEPHLGLSHPRSLAVTDDGDEDDADETLYATEFFSVPLPGAGAADEPGSFDRSRQGFVYPIRLAQSEVGEPIAIAPVDDTGFVDSRGAMTGCYPNQLYAAAVEGRRLFVTSMCASPEGPLGPAPDNAANFKTVVHPTVFVIDTESNQELPELRMLLNAELEQRGSSGADPLPRMPLIPNDLVFAASELAGEGSSKGCLTAMGSNAVYCLRLDGDGRLQDIGSSAFRHVDLAARGFKHGHMPIGLALSRRRPAALVVNDNSQNVAVVDLEAGAVRQMEPTASKVERAAEVLDSPQNAGRRHFVTGLDVWSHRGQGWLSCEGCHPDGLSDGVIWFFARGPRRTLSTAPTYYGDGERRVLLWTGNADEVHDVEGIVRSVAGGVGAVLWQYPSGAATNDVRIVFDGSTVPPGKPTSSLRQNLNGSVAELMEPPATPEQVCGTDATVCDSSTVRDWDEIDAFIASVRTPRRPARLDSQQVARGAELFRAARCAGCHAGPGWTLSRVFYTPGATENGALPYARPSEVTDAELGRLRLESYVVPEELRGLNPAGASGSATYRRWDPPPDRDPVIHLYGKQDADGYDSAKTHGGDQINCVLRAVGTFPAQPDDPMNVESRGIVPAGSNVAVSELRQDMSTLALGATGFNIPSLLGLATSAPYFHAGNARSLEEVFDPSFAKHHEALATLPLSESERRDLIAFLLSIDDDKPDEDVESALDLCSTVPGSR